MPLTWKRHPSVASCCLLLEVFCGPERPYATSPSLRMPSHGPRRCLNVTSRFLAEKNSGSTIMFKCLPEALEGVGKFGKEAHDLHSLQLGGGGGWVRFSSILFFFNWSIHPPFQPGAWGIYIPCPPSRYATWLEGRGGRRRMNLCQLQDRLFFLPPLPSKSHLLCIYCLVAEDPEGAN